MLKYSHYNGVRVLHSISSGELKNFLYTIYKASYCSNYKGNAEIPLICLQELKFFAKGFSSFSAILDIYVSELNNRILFQPTILIATPGIQSRVIVIIFTDRQTLHSVFHFKEIFT